MITGEQVKAARELLGWSHVRLAGKSGLSDATVAKFERGEMPLSVSVFSVSRIKRTPLNAVASSSLKEKRASG
jgi:transcriptional regulator with XRE-family HTH domain